MSLYFYSSHLGSVYATEYPLSDKETYCETCGDWDIALGFAANRAEAKEILKDCGLYSDETIKGILDEYFGERRESE